MGHRDGREDAQSLMMNDVPRPRASGSWKKGLTAISLRPRAVDCTLFNAVRSGIPIPQFAVGPSGGMWRPRRGAIGPRGGCMTIARRWLRAVRSPYSFPRRRHALVRYLGAFSARRRIQEAVCWSALIRVGGAAIDWMYRLASVVGLDNAWLFLRGSNPQDGWTAPERGFVGGVYQL